MWHLVTMVHSPSKFTYSQSIVMKVFILLRSCKNSRRMQVWNMTTNFEMYFDNMDKLLKLRARVTLCGHGSTKILRQNPGPTATCSPQMTHRLAQALPAMKYAEQPFKKKLDLLWRFVIHGFRSCWYVVYLTVRAISGAWGGVEFKAQRY
jgi:hypothetical protein